MNKETNLSVLSEAPFFEPGWWYYPKRSTLLYKRQKVLNPKKKKDFSGIFYCIVGDHCWKEVFWRTGQNVKKSRIVNYSKDQVYYQDRPERICSRHENALESASS